MFCATHGVGARVRRFCVGDHTFAEFLLGSPASISADRALLNLFVGNADADFGT
jgi:hypothetical protein